MKGTSGNSDSAAPAAAQGAFSTTHWSVVLTARLDDPKRARAAMERLCSTYWYPLYAYLRRRGYQPVDAEDLVQGFIEHLLECRFFELADPQKGRFRSYLLTSLNHFVSDVAARTNALKRGGGKPALTLDVAEIEHRYALELTDTCNPEQLYERRWALTLLEVVLKRLEQEVMEAGRGRMFSQLKGVLTGDRGGMSHAELARRLDMSEAAVTMAVHRLRRRFRQLIRSEIAHTVRQPDEIEDEMRHLCQVLSG
jgi:RNA polymerase sigma-70 factor (ECF subfamily)